MRIVTRLKLAAWVPAFIALFIGFALLLSYETMKDSLEEGKTARQIMHGMNELNDFVRSYMRYREDRPKFQFLTLHDSVTGLLATIRFNSIDEEKILNSIRHNSESMKGAFLKLVSNYEISGSVANSALLKEAEERLGGRILTKARDVLSDALRLESVIHEEISATQRNVSVLVIFLIAATTFPLTVALIGMMRSINRSLAALRKGTEVIAGGNLNHRVGSAAQDEIGDVSRAFDLMTEKLRETTVSRDELSDEVEERKRIEEALRQSREWLRVTLRSIGDAVLATDREGRISFLNPVAEALTGWKLVEALGKPIQGVFRIINEKTHEPAEDIVARVLREGHVVALANHTALLNREGQEIPIEDSAAPIRDNEGNVSGVVLVFHDVTEQRRASESLRKAHDDLDLKVRERTASLARANRELQDFVFIAAHDLQEPLRKIITFGGILTRNFQDALGEKGKAHLFRMTGEAGRMSDLLRSLLGYSRLFSLERPFKATDLTRVVEGVVRDFALDITDLGGEVEVGGLPTVEGDPEQMRLLFVNLIQNALKFCRGTPNPRIVIRGEAGVETCRIVVQDNGIGFAQQYAEKIFTPFQRLHGRESGYEGTGMGLAVCRKIVELHGGKIRAEGSPGEGAAFTVSLPVRQSPPAAGFKMPPGSAFSSEAVLSVDR